MDIAYGVIATCHKSHKHFRVMVSVMVFKATFNNISVISWRSVLLVEESAEYPRPITSHWQTLTHSVVSSTPIYKTTYDGGRLTTIVDRYGTDSA